MHDYIWIPSSIKEMQFIVRNNPHLFSPYFLQKVNEDTPSLMIFYYNKRSCCVESYDWVNRMTAVEIKKYISRSVKNINENDLATFIKTFKNVKYRNIVKY